MVNIQGIHYPVIVVEADTMESVYRTIGVVGHWDYGKGIEISNRLEGDTKLPTLMHEIIHGIDGALEIELTEHQTQLLAVGFLQFMQANGSDPEWLRNLIDEVEDET